VTGYRHSRTAIKMTLVERRYYVRWWIERSGLTREQLRQIATGMWSGSSVEATDSGRPASVGR
jgi:hypothetical protein